MYDTDRLKHLIGEASFDGWIENDGPNCDQDGSAQLLKEDDALKALEQAKKEFPIDVQPEKVIAWAKRWLGLFQQKETEGDDKMKKLWEVDVKYQEEDGVWQTYRIITENFGETLKIAQKLIQDDQKEDASSFRITRIEEGRNIDSVGGN